MKNSNNNKLEILSPTGKLEAVYAAVRNGATAVYFGGKKFSARASAQNFSEEEIAEAVKYCHLHNVKIYQAINTLFFDDEINEALKTAEKSLEIGVDALIVQDLGLASLLIKKFPSVTLNASTQMSVHSKKGAEFVRDFGFSRVVLARELSLGQIANISEIPELETEVFVHGALCMAVSGQCYMSALIGSRSANRGLCAGSCRLAFSAIKNEERYDLSLKDLSAVELIPVLEKAGVSSLKIEGRMKRPEYVAAATGACSDFCSTGKADLETLGAVFSRSGFTSGYLTDEISSEMFGTRTRDDVVCASDVLPALARSYKDEVKSAVISFHAEIKGEKPVKLTAFTTNRAEEISVEILGDCPEIAINKSLDISMLEKQLSKLGATRFSLGEITAEIGDGLTISAAKLNALRREALEKIDEIVLSKNRKTISVNEDITLAPKRQNRREIAEIYVSVYNITQFYAVKTFADFIAVPLEFASSHLEEISAVKEKIVLKLPRFTSNEEQLFATVKNAVDLGYKKLECNNISHVKIANELEAEIFGGAFLNVTNSATATELHDNFGLNYITASLEAKLGQIANLDCSAKIGAVVFGRASSMLTKICPIKYSVGCKNCKRELYDRTGRVFPVICSNDYVEIFNSETTVMLDRLREMSIDFARFDFTTETPEDITKVISAYKNGENPCGKFTRGLYYRGVE